MDIQHYFRQVPDFRRAQGLRYPLESTLTIILMAVMSGYSRYREIAAFAQRHEALLQELLSLKHGVPSHVTIREIIMNLDFGGLLTPLNQWFSSLASPKSLAATGLSPDEPLVINIDGKSIRSTLSDYAEPYQDFVCFVHAYATKQGLLVQTLPFQNKETGEAEVVRDMISHLRIPNVIYTLDALHAQKKQSR